MKAAAGQYFNFFSEAGYDNYGLKLVFDIMIIFPESFYLDKDVTETLEIMLDGKLRDLGMRHPLAKKDEVYDEVKLVLEALDYEYMYLLVRQGITHCSENWS